VGQGTGADEWAGIGFLAEFKFEYFFFWWNLGIGFVDGRFVLG
jgi:hypothetical protein